MNYRSRFGREVALVEVALGVLVLYSLIQIRQGSHVFVAYTIYRLVSLVRVF